ncbi:MAG: DUF3160 domain-containing protein [Candidatus Peribacteria bacterium]|nr:DUF3160 domain-containing protein [Candidatus Peribacteria bacterium]
MRERAKVISKTLVPVYQKLIPQIVEKILKANDERAADDFLAIFADDFLNQPDIQIQQDYTQFKPRAHYTDSSLLKTYFMAMKWLMREKFYFGSSKLTQAAFVMVNTIKDEDLQELNQLSEQIKNLIGTDDDVTLYEMKNFVRQYVFGSESIPILQDHMDSLTTKLKKLRPQKIQSSHYFTPQCTECITEDAAKSMTEGFVFFGEKFTLDSYLFDLMTAGSAEKEFTEKPNIHTALMIPDILEDSPLANQLVYLRLQEKSQQTNVA